MYSSLHGLTKSSATQRATRIPFIASQETTWQSFTGADSWTRSKGPRRIVQRFASRVTRGIRHKMEVSYYVKETTHTDRVLGWGTGGDAVTVMMELKSGNSMLPTHAPLASYRRGGEVKVWRYSRALRALREATLAAGDGVTERVIQREIDGSPGCFKAYNT